MRKQNPKQLASVPFAVHCEDQARNTTKPLSFWATVKGRHVAILPQQEEYEKKYLFEDGDESERGRNEKVYRVVVVRKMS